MIGTINFVHYKKKYHWAEVGYVLNSLYWNKGFMTEALEAVIEFSFDHLGLNKIQAGAMTNNPGSYKVMKKAGMKKIGTFTDHAIKNNEFVDIVYYEIHNKNFEKTL
jgi:RimJ/RimL family protein N-acetyltransferase